MDQRGSSWKWMLTIFKCKNEFPKQLELKSRLNKWGQMGSMTCLYPEFVIVNCSNNCYIWMHDTPCSSVSVVDFKQVIAGWDICLLERLFSGTMSGEVFLVSKIPKTFFLNLDKVLQNYMWRNSFLVVLLTFADIFNKKWTPLHVFFSNIA